MTATLKDSLTCCIPPELAAVASKELNETPSSRRESLTEIRRRLSSENDQQIQEDAFLLRFLRCKKFDVPRAMSVYYGYHRFREENPSLFQDLTPESVRHIWEAGIIGGLPHRDINGRAVMVAFPGRWNPEAHSLEDILRAMILQLEYFITSVETQINGIVLIADFNNLSLYQVRCIRPWYFQLMSSLVQNAFPARFKGVFILNQPWYIRFVMAIVSRLLSEKMNSRIHMLGWDREQLEENFNMDNLPEEFGGLQAKYDSLAWVETMLNDTSDSEATPLTTPTSLNTTV